MILLFSTDQADGPLNFFPTVYTYTYIYIFYLSKKKNLSVFPIIIICSTLNKICAHTY